VSGWPNDNTLALTQRLDRLGIDWVVGGSFASSVFGEARTTQDVDISIRVDPGQFEALLEDLRDAYYIPMDTARLAVREHSSFSIIELGTTPHRKFDLFVCSDRPLDEEDFSRRRLVRFTSDPNSWGYVSAPRSSCCGSSIGNRRGGGVSDQQWRDILGVLKVQAGRLDLDFLRRMSTQLQITDLLDRALLQSGLARP
jgi:hypothetical protein